MPAERKSEKEQRAGSGDRRPVTIVPPSPFLSPSSSREEFYAFSQRGLSLLGKCFVWGGRVGGSTKQALLQKASSSSSTDIFLFSTPPPHHCLKVLSDV